jgi:arsenic resistance protein ArsH
MFTIPDQSSIPKAYTQFPEEGQPADQRLIPSSKRDLLVDCMEELVKYTILTRPHMALFSDRFSEREEKKANKTERTIYQHRWLLRTPSLRSMAPICLPYSSLTARP